MGKNNYTTVPTGVKEPQPLPAELEAYLFGEENTSLIEPTNVQGSRSVSATTVIPAQDTMQRTQPIGIVTEEMLLPPLSQEYQVEEERVFSRLAIVSAVLFAFLGFLVTPLAVVAMWRIYTKKQRGMWLAATVAGLGIITFSTVLLMNSFGTQVVYVERG